MSAVKVTFKRGLRLLFETGQRVGVNGLPKHFYSSIPDIRDLRREESWRRPFEMFGVLGSEIGPQAAFLEDLCPEELAVRWAGLDVHGAACRENGQGGGYGTIEAEVLFAFILRHRPARIVQVGCGVSTSVVLRAAGEAGYAPDIICIEPYPSEFLSRMSREGRIRLIAERAEAVERDVLTGLGPGDLLFVDSTHTVKPGSEVNRIILDVLPRLKAGVFIHFHDVYFPYDYQRGLLSAELFFNAESTLLHAFLVGNPR
jgi:hypothetical protein